MLVFLFVAVLLSVQVQAYPTHLGEVRSNWVDVTLWKREVARQRLKKALPGFKVRWWKQKVIFRDEGGLSITPRWYIKHKWALLKLLTSLLFLTLSWHYLGVPLAIPLIDSTQTGDYDVGATWVGGVPPATGDDARVMGTHVVTQTQPETCGSMEIQATGTLDQAGFNLICDSFNAGGFIFDNDGTHTANSGTLTFQDDGANVKVDFQAAGNPYDIIVDFHDWDVIQDTNMTCEHDLTITTGDWDTSGSDYDCTVDFDVDVTGGFIGNASAVVHGSLTINNTGTYGATSGTTTLTSESGTSRTIDNQTGGTFNANSGTVDMQNTSACFITMAGSGNMYNVTITGTANTHSMTGMAAMTIDNDLTVGGSAHFNLGGSNLTVSNDLTVPGEMTTHSSNNKDLTVTGDVDVAGDLIGNASAISLGSLIIQNGGTYDATSGTTTFTAESGAGEAFDNVVGGTITHNNGTLTFSYTGSNTNAYFRGTGNAYNIIVNNGARTLNFRVNPTTIDNDLTITGGTVNMSAGNEALAVTGDLDITGTLTGGTANHSFGSLTINSGGEYDATSGTTTITSHDGSTNAAWVLSGGTYTHNNGTLHFNDTLSNQYIRFYGTGNPYNLTMDKTARSLNFDDLTIDNDLTITTGSFKVYQGFSDILTVTGDVSVTGTLGQAGVTAAWSFASLTINGGGIYSATTGVTTITSETAGGLAWDDDGTFTHNSGTVTFTYAGTTNIDAAGDFYNVILNHASLVWTQTNAVVVANDLTITLGEATTSGSNFDLTVTGDVDVTGTLTGNASAISAGSLTIEAAGTYDATSGTTTITSENAGTGYALNHDGTLTHNNGTVEVQTPLLTAFDMLGTGNLYNLIINHAAADVWFEGGATLDNDLTITLGTFRPFSAANVITVTGDVSVTGTLGGNSGSGAYSFGSLTIASGGTYSATTAVTTITSETAGGYALINDAAGVFTHNNGTLTFTYASTTLVDLGGDSAYNFIVNHATIVVTLDGNGLDCAGDLTVTAGEMDCLALGLSVTGDVDLSDVLDGNTSAVSMGSLTINNGGLYDATDGTTSITSETAGGDSVHTASGGTYTHNNGLLEVVPSTDSRLRFEGTGDPYDLEYNAPGQTVTLFGANLTVANDFTVTDGDFDTSTLDLAVAGATSITGTLTGNSSTVDLAATVIEIGGTISAPDGSGALTISNWFDNSGTFTHNDGTVTFDGATGPAINQSGTVEPVFYNLTIDKAAGSWEVAAMKDITVEAALTITTGKLVLDGTGTTVTLTMGTVAVKGLITISDTLLFATNTTNRTSIVATSSAFPCEVAGAVSWDSGGNLSLVTVQDLIFRDDQTVGTDTVTVTATRCAFNAALTVTTATLEGTMCTIDVTNLTVSSGLYVEGWFDLTDNTRGGYDWILVAGDYTIASNTTYTSRVNFYKPGGATLTVDTGVTLTTTDATIDGTVIVAEADLVDTNNGTFTVKYTMDMKIVDSIAVAIQNVVLTLYDQFDVQLWTQTTDSNGDITAQATIAAIYGIGARTNNNVNLQVVLSGYQTLNYEFTLDRPMDYTLGLPAAATGSTGIGSSWYKDSITIYQVTNKSDYAQRTYDAGTVVACRVNQLEVELTAPDGTLFTSAVKITCPAGTAVDVDDKVKLPDNSIIYVKQVQNVKNAPGAAVMVVIFS